MNLKSRFLNLKNKKISLVLSFLFTFVLIFYIYSNRQNNINEEDVFFTIEPNDRYELISKNSSYTIIEYFDLDCHFCKELHDLKKENSKDFKNLNLIVRNYPLLNSGKSAYKALLGECIAEQEGTVGWFNYVDMMYSHFDKKDDYFYLKKMSDSLVTDKENFESCIASENMKNKIRIDRSEGVLNQVDYVPSFLIFKDGKFIKKYVGVSGQSALELFKYYNNHI